MEGESMNGGMDYGEFEQLAKNFKQLMKDYNKFLGDFLIKEGNKNLADVKRNTPGPNSTGRLRNSWKLSGPFKRGDTRYVVVHTNVKYAPWVENGHRIVNQYGTYGWQPGKHMAKNALFRTELNLDKNFNKAFNNFCRTRGIGK